MSENERPSNSNPNGSQGDSVPHGGILAALPRARPQRASPRRAAARSNAAAAEQIATRTPADPANKAKTSRTSTAKKPTHKAKAKPVRAGRPRVAGTGMSSSSSAKTVEPPAPKQGYEPEEQVELGATVNPPSGVELVESVADIVGQLANSGLAAGGRLLKDAFSLLRRP